MCMCRIPALKRLRFGDNGVAEVLGGTRRKENKDSPVARRGRNGKQMKGFVT